MAITNYNELKTAIAAWANRSDLSAQLADFVTLAEADLKVRARLTQWDTETSLTVTAGSATLPNDFAAAVSVQFGDQTTDLEYMTPRQLKDRGYLEASGDPVAYSIIADTLRVAPSASGNAALLYIARFTSLSDSAPTNSLLTLFPDVYLYGALVHAAVYLRDSNLATAAKGAYEEALGRLNGYMDSRRFGNAPLQIRVS